MSIKQNLKNILVIKEKCGGYFDRAAYKFYKPEKGMQQVKSLADLAQITECLDTHFIPRKITRKSR